MAVSLPGIDLDVSGLCLGTGSFGTAIAEADAFAMLDRFVELGGNFLDTAKVYGDWVPEAERSASEKVIGRWIKERACRNKIVIGTKGAHHDLSTPKQPRVSPADITSDLEASIKSLQVDTIDLYWLHRDDASVPVEYIVDTLESHRRHGKIRSYGASNWKPERIASANAYAAAAGAPGFVADQILWNAAPLVSQPYGDPTVDFMSEERYVSHVRTGMAEIPYQSQANGLFNKIQALGAENAASVIGKMYGTEETIRRYKQMSLLVSESGLSITQIVLGYLKGQPFPTIPIIGCRNMEQLEDSMSALDVVLPAEQIAKIADHSYYDSVNK